MRQVRVVIAISMAMAIIPTKVESIVELPRKGAGLFYLCDGAKLTKMRIEGVTAHYDFKGECSIVITDPFGLPHVINEMPVVAKASYDSVYAREAVELLDGSNITSTRRCTSDPFRSSTSDCLDGDPINVLEVESNFSPPYFKLSPPRDYPLMAGNATEQAIAASSGLVEADPETVDLSDWNPIAKGVSEPAAIEIQTPSPYAILPAGMTYDVTVRRKAGPREPLSVLMLFEGLEKAPANVGDIALPAEQTHWWVARWSIEVDWNSVPFQAGLNRATKVLTNEGIYRVRVRATQASGGYLGGWTEWRVFCVGEQEACANMRLLSQLGDKTQTLFHQSLQEKAVIRKP